MARANVVREAINGHAPSVGTSALVAICGVVVAVYALPWETREGSAQGDQALALQIVQHEKIPAHGTVQEDVTTIKVQAAKAEARSVAAQKEREQMQTQISEIRREQQTGFREILRRLPQ